MDAKNQEHAKYINDNHINYNVFSILKMSTREVRLHSAFLSDLLNPKGKHGLGNTFLNSFIQILSSKTCSEHKAALEAQSKNFFAVTPEKYIGKINNEKTKGGRIDILLENKDYIIAIENKIYAVDQENQLIRYYNYIKEKNKEGLVVYLTLDHRDMDDYSDRYVNITYKDDIALFLRLSIENNLPSPIKGILEQYLRIIEKLTGTSITHEYRRDIMNIILESPENVIAAKEISENYAMVETELLKMYFDKLKNKLKELSIEYTLSSSTYIQIIVSDNVYLDFKYSSKILFVGVQIKNSTQDLSIIKNQMIAHDGFDGAQFAVCKKETRFNLASEFKTTVNMLYDKNESDIFDDIIEVFQVVKDKNI